MTNTSESVRFTTNHNDIGTLEFQRNRLYIHVPPMFQLPPLTHMNGKPWSIYNQRSRAFVHPAFTRQNHLWRLYIIANESDFFQCIALTRATQQ